MRCYLSSILFFLLFVSCSLFTGSDKNNEDEKESVITPASLVFESIYNSNSKDYKATGFYNPSLNNFILLKTTGSYFTTTDNFQNINEIQLPKPSYVYYKTLSAQSAYFFSPTSLLLGCINGEAPKKLTFLKTIDSGSTWTLSNTPVEMESCGAADIAFVNSTNGFIVCGENIKKDIAYKTTDSGSTWTMIELPKNKGTYTKIFFTDNQTGYMTGHTITSGIVLKTIDGGNTWSVFTMKDISIKTAGIYGGIFIDDLTGYFFGNTGYIVKTINGGINWDNISVPTKQVIADIYTQDGKNIYACSGNSGHFFRSVDGGKIWHEQIIDPSLGLQFLKIIVVDKTLYLYGSYHDAVSPYGIALYKSILQ